MENLRLIRPNMAYMDSFRQAIDVYNEYDIEDFSYPDVSTNFKAKRYIKNSKDWERGKKLPKGKVPHSIFWLADDSNFLGEGHIRHTLNEYLKHFGGNIGYSIHPHFWRRGLGSLQLSLLLVEAKKIGLKAPIITCFEDNTASIKIVEKHGGQLIEKVYNRIGGKNILTRIYEIELG